MIAAEKSPIPRICAPKSHPVAASDPPCAAIHFPAFAAGRAAVHMPRNKRCRSNAVDPVIMSLDVRLHRIDIKPQLQPLPAPQIEAGSHRLLLPDIFQISSPIADQQSLSRRLASIQRFLWQQISPTPPPTTINSSLHRLRRQQPGRHRRNPRAGESRPSISFNSISLMPHDGNDRNTKLQRQSLRRNINPPPAAATSIMLSATTILHAQSRSTGPIDKDSAEDCSHPQPRSQHPASACPRAQTATALPSPAVSSRRSADDAVRPRQIDHLRDRSIRQFASPGFFFDGDARIVGDFLAKAREAVEDCGFAAVGITCQGDCQCPAFLGRVLNIATCGHGINRLLLLREQFSHAGLVHFAETNEIRGGEIQSDRPAARDE